MKPDSWWRPFYVFVGLLALILAIGLVVVIPILFDNTGPLKPEAFAKGAAAQSVASLPAAWSHWKYFRAIDLSAAPAERLVSVEVPQGVYARSENRLADLRIIDDTGAEAPYFIEARYGAQQTSERACRLQEKSFVPGQYSQIVCDAGDSAGFHNGIRIESPEQNFMAWAEVAVSDNARLWRIVNDRSPIYEFSARNLTGVNTLHYGETNARYVRLRVFRADKAFTVNSIFILHGVTQKKESAPIDAKIAPDAANFEGETVFRAELGEPGLPVDEIGIETTQPEFSRRVSVESSSDGINWSYRGSGDVYRFRQGDAQKESLRIGLYDQWSPYLRIHIANGNDPPLAALRVTLYMTPRKIAFRQQPGRNYLLLYGQSEAHSPQYDIGQTVNAEQVRAATLADGVGAEAANAAWSDPRPWTDRHTAVLWVAAILAAALLALLALRSLRSPAPPRSGTSD